MGDTTLSNYLKKYENTDKLNRLQEFIVESHRLSETIASRSRRSENDYFYHNQHQFFVIWTLTCWQFYADNSDIFPSLQDHFRGAGVVPMFQIIDVQEYPSKEGDQRMKEILEELKSKTTILIESVRQLKALGTDKIPLVITDDGQIYLRNNEGKRYSPRANPKMVITKVLESKNRSISMKSLANALNISSVDARRVADIIADLNKVFIKKVSSGDVLIINDGNTGYRLNSAFEVERR
jgi:hypothetical protein